MPDFTDSIRDPNVRLALARSLKEAVVCLDIDECSYLGGDSNDIIRVLQHCAREVIDGQRDSGEKQSIQELRSSPDFRALLRMLVNPKMVEAVKAVRESLGYQPAIVIYTAKYDLVDKSRDASYMGFFEAWQRSPAVAVTQLAQEFEAGSIVDPPRLSTQAPIKNEILIPGDDVAAGPDYFIEKLVTKSDIVGIDANKTVLHKAGAQLPWAVAMHFQRAGFMFWAIAEELGLKYIPHAVVTAAGDKDLSVLSKILDVPFEKLVLFDDKSERHASRIKPEPLSLDDARMVQIQPYTFQTMDQKRRAELQALVRKVMPDKYLREGLASHESVFNDASAMNQNGWPRENLVLTRDYTWRLGQEKKAAGQEEEEDGQKAKAVPLVEQEDWPLPSPDYLDADRHDHAKRTVELIRLL